MSAYEDQTGQIQALVRLAGEIPPGRLEAWFSSRNEPPEILEAVRRALVSSKQETGAFHNPSTLLMETSDSPRLGSVPPGGFEPDPLSIGPYSIKRRLGEGGFGVVYLAHQEEPIRRDVAIKVVRSGLGGANVLIRFEAERQALAMMSHPALASVIDAGSTDSGDPYFVMEYVAGSPVDELCDEKLLGIRPRLELFTEICEAIQHAHGKGIIHRDLKPGNILVVPDGHQLLPRVIDFGIAKAMDPDDIGTGSVTVEGQFIGTPHYMAPEQTGFTGQDVDVRADVFSLGAVLYELLVGRTPVDIDTIDKAREEGGLVGLKSVLCERSPVRASVSFSRLVREKPGQAAKIARRRGLDERGLIRRLRGDLDWILLKALDLDRDRRYETPLGLAEDLRRYLAFEPVKAGPPSRIYRFSKFARRNRAAVLSVLAIFVVLLVATLYSNAARLNVERRLQETESTLAFVDSSIGDAIDPSYGGGRDLLAVDYFSNAYDAIETDASLSPRVQVRLFEMYARALLSLNDYEKSAECARSGLAVIDANHLDDEVAASANELRFLLAQSLRNQGLQSDVSALEGMIDGDTSEFYASRAFTLHNAGDYDGASWFYEKERQLRAPGGDSFPLSECLGFMGRLALDQGRIQAGARLIRESSEMCERLSDTDGSAVAASLLALGAAACADLRLQEALDYYEQAHQLYLDLHGTEDVFMVELCRIEIQGLLEDASAIGDGLSSSVPAPRGIINTNFLQAIILRNRARMLQRAGANTIAHELITRSLEIEGVDGDYHRHTELALARMLLDDGRIREGLEVVEAMLESLPEGPVGFVPGEAPARALRTELLLELDSTDQAREELARLEQLRVDFPPESAPSSTIRDLRVRLKEREVGN
jgi:serine/threonine protein kinase